MIELTQRAAEKLSQIQEEQKRGHSALRVAVLGGDCAGLKYFIGLDDFLGSDDYVIETEHNVLFVDSQSASYLWGSQVDWIDVEGDGGFVVFNPNKGRSQGGCGQNGQGCMTKGDGQSCLNKKKKEGGCASGACACSSRTPESPSPVHQIGIN